MTLIIEGTAISVYKNPDFKNKETGEVTEGKHKLQLMVETELHNGAVKSEMKDISIPNEKVKEYEGQIGKKVQLKCAYVSKSPVSFYVK